MKDTITKYYCDKCGGGVEVPYENQMDIVTEKQEGTYWSRFHVEIILHQGVHNDGTREKAALCQKCAIDLLTDALKRVKNGERATAGTESSKQRGWSNDI